MREINQEEFFELITDTSGRILIDFFTLGCSQCKLFMPIIDMVTEDRTDVSACKLNAANAPVVCSKYNVRAVPTVILFNDGVEIARKTGPMGRNELEEFLEL